MHSDSDRHGRYGEGRRSKTACDAAHSKKIAATQLPRSRYAYAEPENSAQPVAHFHRAARESAASRHDARRGSVSFGETVETPACSPNDAHAPPVAGRRAQFFPGPERDAADFPATLCKSGGGRRGERCVAANSAAASETSDAGERPPRPRPTGADLSRVSRASRRHSRYDFHHVHGAAVDRIHGANRAERFRCRHGSYCKFIMRSPATGGLPC